jgi:hypothetical protein
LPEKKDSLRIRKDTGGGSEWYGEAGEQGVEKEAGMATDLGTD